MKKGGARAKRRHVDQVVYGAVYQVVDVAMFDRINWGLFEAVAGREDGFGRPALSEIVTHAVNEILNRTVHHIACWEPPHSGLGLYLEGMGR